MKSSSHNSRKVTLDPTPEIRFRSIFSTRTKKQSDHPNAEARFRSVVSRD